MKRWGIEDTIAAIATPMGESGIGIVRLSGKDALAITESIFLSHKKGLLRNSKSYTVHYGWIVEDKKSKRVIDEVIVTLMRSPRSYTREDVVEINCHGGIVVLRRVLELVLEKGCRLAQPGEFTKRAFLSGRIDLTQAQAVIDIIKAKTESALKIGTEQLRGGLSRETQAIRNQLLGALSILEASIDFPEEELGLPEARKIKSVLLESNRRLQGLLESAGTARLLREGISVAICGKPNVGKSSLLNALLRHERSIVTPVAGTTRDTVEEQIDIKGIPVRIIDTAGIIRPRGMVERKAVSRSRRYIELADLVILLFDGSRRLSGEDLSIMRRLKGRVVLPVINKIDLRQRIEKDIIKLRLSEAICISAKRRSNMGLLEEAIASLAYGGKFSHHEPASISNLRNIEEIKKAQKLIAESLKSVDNDLSFPECVSQDIKDALLILDGLLGRRFSEDLLDKIFNSFCIGK